MSSLRRVRFTPSRAVQRRYNSAAFEVSRRFSAEQEVHDDSFCFYRHQPRRLHRPTERRSFDFLPEGGGEPHGYNEFIATIDALVIGRKTFETVLAFPAWPYGNKRVVVLSSRPVDLSAVRGGIVEQMAGSPADIVAKLAATGAHHLYVDGGITIQNFLRAGLIQRLIITRVPVLIGDGIPLFGALPRDVRLLHIATQHYPSGLVKSEYEVAALAIVLSAPLRP